MFAVFISVLQLIAVVNAFIRSLQERFVVGIVGALARGALLVAGAIGAVAALSAPSVAAGASMALAAIILGPLISFATIWFAHRRKRDVPAAEEELRGRPFKAWLPVALFDAAFVAINILATVISNPF